MFGNAKPMASLSSGLLARKGQARPAMKPQGFAGFNSATSLDDLGWNDMGTSEPPVAPLPDPAPQPPAPHAAAPALPPVLVQREELAAAVEAPAPPVPEPEPEPAPPPVGAQPVSAPESSLPVPAPVPGANPAPVPADAVARIGREAGRSGKAAFTLRLPGDRHLRLRLASAVQRRSAQAVVTDALDRYLATLPEVDDLARQCPPAAPLGDRP